MMVEISWSLEEEEAFLELEAKQKEMRVKINHTTNDIIQKVTNFFKENVGVFLEEEEVVNLLHSEGLYDFTKLLEKVTSSEVLKDTFKELYSQYD